MSESLLAEALWAASARLAAAVGETPAHWGVIDETVPGTTHPFLARDCGDEVEIVGTLIDLEDHELDLIGLFSPQTAAALSALLDRLADWLDCATPGELAAATWLPEAQSLARSLNRQPEWAAHPRGIRMDPPTEETPE